MATIQQTAIVETTKGNRLPLPDEAIPIPLKFTGSQFGAFERKNGSIEKV